MSLPCLMSNIRLFPNLMKLVVLPYILNLFLFPHLKKTMNLILSKAILSLLKLDNPEDFIIVDHNHINHNHDYDDHEILRPSNNEASLISVPVYFFAEAVKKQLPVVTYKSFLEKNTCNNNNNEDCMCIVCLNRVEDSQEVRVLFNCSHVFHRECLDVWVDQGQGNCPLCRSKLLPIITKNHVDNHDHNNHDPWRRERMIYLFGEDYLFREDGQ